ncbi:MAG: hypothetical protein RL681_245 [Candidatus Parcubacteria bacterium]
MKKIVLNTLTWGFALWLFGYILGLVFFALVPPAVIGWYIMPFGIAATLWVLFKKVERDSFGCYVGVGIIWTLLAVLLDYLFIVLMLHPVDGYYKLDVYIYYALTFVLPLIAGWWKRKKK